MRFKLQVFKCNFPLHYIGEVKTLMIQLLKGVTHLHDNWIIHRDLKTSNLLLSHKGILKVGVILHSCTICSFKVIINIYT